MKKLVPIVITALALGVLATLCTPVDTETPKEGRTLLPMLSSQPAHVACNGPQCSTFENRHWRNCNRITTYSEAVDKLTRYSDCIDEVIAVLQRQPLSAEARNNLAVAYYIRAKRYDTAPDLIHALGAAQTATALQPPLPAALFNRALFLEEAALHEDALRAWEEFIRIDRTPWRDEARARRDAVQRILQPRWTANVRHLPAALRRGDLASVRALIAGSVGDAQTYLENDLLGAWGDSGSPELLQQARVLARVIDDVAKDTYATEIVDAAARNPAQMREAHRALRDARLSRKDEQYDKAIAALNVGQSPLRFAARVETAAYRGEGLRMLDTVHGELSAYPRLAAVSHTTRGFLLMTDDPTGAISAYTAAIDDYSRLPLEDALGLAYGRRGGIYTAMNAMEPAVKDVLQAMQRARFINDPQRLHSVVGEAGRAALQLGEIDVALLYQHWIAERLAADLTQLPPGPAYNRVVHNLSIARRERARILGELGRYREAESDLEDATRLAKTPLVLDSYRRMLRAYEKGTEGRLLLARAPEKAVAAFSDALSLVANDAFPTERAELLALRAEARQLSGGLREEIASDMLNALELLDREQQNRQRDLPPSETLWDDHFSRFEATHSRLIQFYADSRRAAEAFNVAERGRARDLRFLAGNTPSELAAVMKALPDRAVMLTYKVTDEHTYCWAITNKGHAFYKLDAGRADIADWLAIVQAEARKPRARADEQRFIETLERAYDGVLAAPLANLNLPHDARIIIVPDGPLHALPFPAFRNRRTGRYLIADATVEIQPSAAFYRYTVIRDSQPPSTSPPSALLVGDPAFAETAQTSTFPRLEAARQEVVAIAAEYANHQMLTNENATIEAFVTGSRSKTVIHYAGHAIVNPGRPTQSFLLLAPDGVNDGALYAKTLLERLNLNQTKLVVLAACSTATGTPVGAEGVGPLVRPLLAQGVPAVVGSLWPVSDDTAMGVFVSFHSSLKNGEDAASALRTAQLVSLQKDSVFTWAPYQVIGYTQSPFGARTK